MLKPFQQLAALPRDARDTLFLLAVIALIVLPQVNNLPLWCSGLDTSWVIGSDRPSARTVTFTVNP